LFALISQPLVVGWRGSSGSFATVGSFQHSCLPPQPALNATGRPAFHSFLCTLLPLSLWGIFAAFKINLLFFRIDPRPLVIYLAICVKFIITNSHSTIPELFCLSGLSVDELSCVSLPCRQFEVLWPSSTASYSNSGASCRRGTLHFIPHLHAMEQEPVRGITGNVSV
jgi:hypothetical protein